MKVLLGGLLAASGEREIYRDFVSEDRHRHSPTGGSNRGCDKEGRSRPVVDRPAGKP